MRSVAKKNREIASEATPRKRGSLDEVLIDAAMDLFAAYGYRGTSLSRIARAAGVTKGALYWHFSDKEEFFIAVVKKVLGELDRPYKERPPATNREEFFREFEWVFQKMAEQNERHPWVTRLLLIITLESHKISPRVLRVMRRGNQEQTKSLMELVDRGKELGAFNSSIDTEWAATQMFAAYLGLADLWYLHGSNFDLTKSLTRQANEFIRQWSVLG
jgi:TetR/AcrR family transcriptional regulator, fatty acid metabolism regulator protein